MFLELHILQNFAPSCLNRDDTNAPKDCEFGGFRRARISSQCIKRSVRLYAKQHAEALGVNGRLATRSKLLHSKLVDAIVEGGKDRDEASIVARFALEGWGLSMDDEKTKVLLFLGKPEIDGLAKAILDAWDELEAPAMEAAQDADDEEKPARGRGRRKKKTHKMPDAVKEFVDAIKDVPHAVDIALFGRMVAETKKMNVDAACQVAHAISTNEVDMEMDFYTAVDDLQPEEDTGAGMMGIVEFNSSCFYRYSLLDMEQLKKNLGADDEMALAAALAYAKGSVFAIPTGKQNSMAAQNLPIYVRAVVRDGSAPRSLTNAFLAPARPDRRDGEDLGKVSIAALEQHAGELDGMYGVDGVLFDKRASTYGEHGDVTVNDLLEGLRGVLA